MSLDKIYITIYSETNDLDISRWQISRASPLKAAIWA